VTAVLRQALANACAPDKLISLRDRALLLIGFAGALRRGELASLEVVYRDGGRGWIETTPEGLVVHLCHSKTNQEGADETIAIPYGTALETCPVRSYAAWVESSGITSGPAFRPIDRHGNVGTAAISDQSVALIVKRAAYAAGQAAGMSDAQASAYAGRFSGHSLRRGLATSAAANDAPARSIQRQLRHRKADTTNGYIEEARLFRQNAAGFAGL
jgi:integrase